MQVVVFANGELLEPGRARRAAEQADLIIAADGGLRHCQALGIRPALVMGDLDSLRPEELAELEAEQVQLLRHPTDKDQTDLELALQYAQERGAERIVVLGAVGGRLDMTAANLLLLADPALRQASVEIWHADQTAFVLEPPGGGLPGQPGDLLSLIPLGGAAEGLVSRDLQYELAGEDLQHGKARGVSNRVTGSQPAIEFRSGMLLVVHMPVTEDRGVN